MKVAIIQYSTYGHITQLARAAKAGVEETGLATTVDIFQIQETLSEEVLGKLYAPPKPKDIPIATIETLEEYDAFLFGVPTRFGTGAAQFFEFWGATGGLWMKGALAGKPAGIFVSTGTQGGGQETTVRQSLSFLVHHGMPYIPVGYAKTFGEVTADEVHGGSPYGAGTYAAGDGSRQPSELELKVAKIQGNDFATSAIKFVKASAKPTASKKTSASNKATTSAAAVKNKSQAAATNVANTATTGAAAVKDKTEAVAKRAEQSKKIAESEEKGFCSKCTIM
ncbi:Flavoprotein-like protein YCP4 [Spathaspora sp. JA1]|nr:Flavoprotein-like protein YCP4 [Spathaspora sp. JA1]